MSYVNFLDAIEFSTSISKTISTGGYLNKSNPVLAFSLYPARAIDKSDLFLIRIYSNSYLDISKSESFKSEVFPQIGKFFKFSSEKDYKQRLTPKNLVNDKCFIHDIRDCYTTVKANHLERNKTNVLRAIKAFSTGQYSLDNPTNIKFMREGCFGKITGKIWNPLLIELEDDGKITVKRTPKGSVRSIVVSSNKDTLNHRTMLKLESRGKLKLVSSNYEKYHKVLRYELFKFNLFPHLKTFLLLRDDKFFIQVDYFSLSYGKNIMNDMGVWQDFKNSLNNKISKKIDVIEKFLEVEFTGTITPMKYEDDSCESASFISKSFEIKLS